MDLYHYSKNKLELKNLSYKQGCYDKPVGLWVTMDDEYDWKNFCIAEEFRLENLKYKNKIELSDSANILIINSIEEFDKFSSMYRDDDFYFYKNWNEISKKYDGIIITKYFWERRLVRKHQWYYSWDCVSGCIWNCSIMRVV